MQQIVYHATTGINLAPTSTGFLLDADAVSRLAWLKTQPGIVVDSVQVVGSDPAGITDLPSYFAGLRADAQPTLPSPSPSPPSSGAVAAAAQSALIVGGGDPTIDVLDPAQFDVGGTTATSLSGLLVFGLLFVALFRYAL